MPQINMIPSDRTDQQPIRAFCANPQCRDKSDKEFSWTVEHEDVACPKCGANAPPFVGLYVLIHMMVPDPAGPIVSIGGARYRLACDPKRAYTATLTNLEAATADRDACNCPGCLEATKGMGKTGRVFKAGNP